MSGNTLPDSESDMRRHLQLREAVFAALQGLDVEGVPVASLVEEALDIDCSTGTLRDPRPADLTLRAQRMALAVLPWIERARGRRRAWPHALAPGRVLVDVASTGHNCRRIWEPIARRLGADRVVLLVPAQAARPGGMDGFEWVSPARFPVDWSRWRAEVDAGYADWIARARGLGAQRVTDRGARRLAGTIALQALRVHQAKAVLEFYRPSALLSLADRGASGAPLVGAARRLGVPTLTILHCPAGSTFGRTFLPLNADRLLVWGEYQREVFQEFGLPAHRIAIVGCPGMERPASADTRGAADRLRALGVPDRRRRVLALTGPMRDEWRSAWFREIVHAARRLPEAAFVVRVHPSERAAFYRSRVDGLDNLAVLENAAARLDETLSAVDAVVVHGSSVGLDALVHGKDLFVLDCLPFTLGTMREVLAAGGAARAASGSELAAALAGAWKELSPAEARRRAGRAFVERFLAAYGDEAARRVVAEIDRTGPAGAC